MRKCTNFFNKILPFAEQTSQASKREMNSFYIALLALFSHYNTVNVENISNEADSEYVVFAMTSYATGFTHKNQLSGKYKLKNETKQRCLDLYLHMGLFATIIELKHYRNKSANSTQGLE